MEPTLSPGTQLGRYKIISQLGMGGMGEVYLAEDTKLDRKIALKILPADVAAKHDRMARFVREAKAAAALNHPNIAHIYEIDEADGHHFIAMEFIDGVTLREKIYGGSGDLRKLLHYLHQVAEGLAKAHAAGIVHRDLKPDNIMITRDRYAKILDFGLAKLVEPPTSTMSGDAGLSEVATAMMPQHSLPGTVMGTIGYMSPEQAQGRVNDVDHRSDIFAFGCLLYEAATRQKAFKGKDALDSLHNIVHAPTPQIKDINPVAPDDLQRIVRRCLAKDPEKRYQSIKDVAIELDEVRQELKVDSELHDSVHQTSSGASATISGPSGISPTMSQSATSSQFESAPPTSSSRIILNELKRHRTGALLALAGLLLVATAGGWFIWQRLNSQKPQSSGKQMKISRLVTGAGSIGNASISPDGKYVAYALYKGSAVSLRVKQVSTGGDREIVSSIDEATTYGTAFSPDGELVYYNLAHRQRSPLGALYQVPVIGGREPKKILDHLSSIIGFAPDGKQFVFIRDYFNTGDSSLMVGSLDGGEPRELARRKGQDWFQGIPSWSPDGRVITCIGGSDTGGTQFTLLEVPVDGGTPRSVSSHRWHGQAIRPTWLKDGSGLIVNAQDLPGSPMQIAHVSYPEGVVTRITNDLTEYGSSSFGLTEDSSTIVTIIDNTTTRIWLSAADGEDEGRARRLTNGNQDGFSGVALTPDERVVYTSKTGEHMDAWIVKADGSEPRQLTTDQPFVRDVEASPDGRYIVFSATAAGVQHIWRIDADGSNVKQLTYGAFADTTPLFSPDGQWVVFGSWRSGNPRLWRVSIDGGDPVQISDLPVAAFSFLPDGKTIFGSYFDEQVSPPKWRLALVPFDGGPPLKVFDFPPKGKWWQMSDERTLFYVERNNDVDNIWSRGIDGGTPKQLTKFTSEYIFDFARSRDGKQFAMARGTSTADVILIKDFR
ncbi:MAG TPA: protein kinase [Pyrinomonadaceae bacterium]|nr:protein kinase [Pyrinomonadaceae bacterium]